MKRWVGVAILVCLGAATAFTAPQGSASPPSNVVAGELVVKFRPTVATAQRNTLLGQRLIQRIRHYATLDIDHLKLPGTLSVDDAVQALKLLPEVLAVQPNYIRHAIASPPPNDPFWLSDQLWGLEQIQADKVWNVLHATGDGSVVIADIDTGIDYNHPDLAANVWVNPGEIAGNGKDDDGDGYVDDVHGINVVPAHPTGDPMDDEGHGTHTAGTLAAVGNNGVGVVGVNWNAKVLSCKFLDASGSGTDDGAIACFDYVLWQKQHGVNIRVTNNSWGGERGAGGVPTALQMAMDAVGNAGILNVVAAGNSSENIDVTPFDPASLSVSSPSILAVAASDQSDNPASFTNYGPNSVALAAPGVGIVSTYVTFNPTTHTYATASGTSMATPHVAGTAALLAFLDPSLMMSQLKSILTGSVDVLSQWNGMVSTGGRLNAYKAAIGTGIDQPPTVLITAPTGGATYTAPATVPITVLASDPDGTVASVAFYANGTPIGTSTTAPFNFTWTNVAAGSYTLTAVATDNLGLAGAPSAGVAITVNQQFTAVNVALATNGGSASASSSYSAGYPAAAAINGDRKGSPAGSGGYWNDATPNTFPDWLEVDFTGTPTIGEVDVFSVQDNYTSPSTPTPTMTFSLYGLKNFEVQYWTGSAWQDVPGGAITNNNLVWRQVTFTPLATGKIRVWVTGTLDQWSRIAEVEAWTANGAANQPPTVSITSPTGGATYTAPASVPITVLATDPDGTVASVAYYANGNSIGTSTTAPFSFTWANVAAGSYTLTAVATDNLGLAGAASPGVGITVNPTGGQSINVALATNGASASASSTYGGGYPASAAINGDRTGAPAGSGGYWNDATPGTFPDWLEVDFTGTQTIGEVDVFSVQDNYSSPSTPTPTMTFTQYGLTNFEAQYWTGSAWQDVPGGSITNNNLVWRKVTFTALATSKVRVLVNGTLDQWSRIAEVEAWTSSGAANQPPTVSITAPAGGATYTAPASVPITVLASDPDGTVASVAFFANGNPIGTSTTAPFNLTWTNAAAGSYTLTAVATDNLGLAGAASPGVAITVNPGGGQSINVALATNGGSASASSSYSGGYPASAAINGDRTGAPAGSGGYWNDATPNTFPDWLEVDFTGTPTIGEVDVFSTQDNYTSPSTPTPTMAFSLYGLKTFEVQYWTGSAWQDVPGGTITNNNLVWRKVTFAALATSKVRVLVNGTLDQWSRIAEVEAWTASGSGNQPPTVSITAPTGGATYTAPATVPITVQASDPDGTVASVAFYANGTPIGTSTTAPFSFTWTSVAAGSYTLTAVATDNLGLAGSPSPGVAITVNMGAQFIPAPVQTSDLTVRLDAIGQIPTNVNPTSPVVAGSHLLLIDQAGEIYNWSTGGTTTLLDTSSLPSGITALGNETVLNAASNATGTTVFVVFTSSTVPGGIPQRLSPRPGADGWQVLYQYAFDGSTLTNPTPITALQVRYEGHTGGGLTVLADGSVLFATGDNGDAGEDGLSYAQDPTTHLSKILHVNPTDGSVQIVAMGVRNVQRLMQNQDDSGLRLDFVDIGGSVAEELDSIPLATLLDGTVHNFGWGRNGTDGMAREGTFYISPTGTSTGLAPTPEAGFLQPSAQFGREGATLIAATGPVTSAVSFVSIASLFGDLVSGSVYGVIGLPSVQGQAVYRVNLVDNTSQSITLSGLTGGNRPDPRFFTFPDGSAGVLLEHSGAFFKLTEQGGSVMALHPASRSASQSTPAKGV